MWICEISEIIRAYLTSTGSCKANYVLHFYNTVKKVIAYELMLRN